MTDEIASKRPRRAVKPAVPSAAPRAGEGLPGAAVAAAGVAPDPAPPMASARPARVRAPRAAAALPDAAQLPAVVPSDTGKAEAQAAFENLDHTIHAAIGRAVGGLSPIALAAAWADWAAHMAISPGKQAELGWKAARKWQRLIGTLLCRAQGGAESPCIEPLPQDRRFAAPEWQRYPFSLWSQSFLLTQQWWHNATTGVHGVEDAHEKLVEFYGRQLLDMVSPANFALTNPEVIERTAREGGANLLRGAGFLAEDVARAATSNPAAPAFRPGHEVAATPGRVVLRNRLIELIQYTPTTETVHPVPLLIVPAWIMKYYILDLAQTSSLIRWLVAQGFTVFCISWKNPTAADRMLGFDDYRELGVMAALDAIGAITGAPQVHALGYCLGGTLLSVAAAAMARDGDARIASLTMLAAQVDFTEAGELSLFTTEAQLALLEDMMWEDGFLDKSAMAGTFSMLKSQDLIWSRMVREYLMGEREATSELGAWSRDATRMPYRMHSEYLRRMFLQNDLAEGRMQAGGRTVHLQDIRAPVFAVATEHDHIAPWKSVFKLTWLLPGDVSFALVSGGHNTGIVAPPGSPRARFRLLPHRPGESHPGAEDWLAATPPQQGSWWQPWADWLRTTGGEGTIAPPAMGLPDAPALGRAPGRYVLRG